MFNEQSKELTALCNTLRAGDVVTIHMSHYMSDDPKGKPFTTTLIKVDQRESDYHVGGAHGYIKSMPLIHWEPRDPEDYISCIDDVPFPSACCSAHFVTEIVARKPYRVNNNLVRNSLYSGRLHTNKRALERGRKINQEYSNSQLQGPLYSAHGPIAFAEDLLSYDAYLDIPQGLSAQRLTAEWKKAGYPGLRGGFRWKDQKIVAHYPHNQFDNGGISLFDVVDMLIHRRQFRDWLITNLSKIIRTKQELAEDGKRSADHEKKMYEEDMDYMLSKEFGSKFDDEKDTHEEHMEEMFDWD